MLRVMVPMLFCLLGVVLAQAPGRGWLLVANKGDQSLGIVDVAAGKQVATVAEDGKTGHEVAASPDGRTAYVPIYGDSGVGKPGTDGDHMLVIDLASRKVTGKVNFGRGVRPHLPVFGPHDGMLYVTTELDQAITIVDPKTLKIAGQIPTGQAESHMLAISHDGRRGYTANVGPGTVSVLDMEARKTLAIIPISGETQRISISPDDKMVFTSDQKAPRLAVIDTATNKVKNWVDAAGRGLRHGAHAGWQMAARRRAFQEPGGDCGPRDHESGEELGCAGGAAGGRGAARRERGLCLVRFEPQNRRD